MKYLMLLAVLSGCADLDKLVNTPQESARYVGPEGELAKKMDPLIGADEIDLVSKLGPPSNIYKAESGHRIFTYEKSSFTQKATVIGGVFVHREGSRWCKIMFKLNPMNKVESWNTEGNACY